MSNRTLTILLAVFLIFALISAWPRIRQLLPESLKPTQTFTVDFTPFTEAATTQVDLGGGKVLKKDNGKWKINEFDASEQKVKDFFAKVSKLKVRELASKNTENHKSFFDVADEEGTVITFITNGQASTLIFGNPGPDFQSFYVKKKDSAEVYLVGGSITSELSQTVNDWRDKTIVKIPKDSVSKIELLSPTAPLTLTKGQDNKWQAEGGGKKATLEDMVASQLLVGFDPLQGTDFLTDKERAEFTSAKNKIILRLFGTKQDTLTELSLLKKDTTWWAKPGDKELFVKVPSVTIERVVLPYETVFK